MRVTIPKPLLVCLFLLDVNLATHRLPAQSPQASLHGTITDPSGASVPGALIQLRSATGEFRAKADGAGQYSFASVRPGKYLVRVIAKGFTVSQRQDFEIKGPTALGVQLTIETETQVVNVEDEANKVSADAASNGTALVLGEKELAMLSDDPDELEQELQAMAGPGAGPSGGQIYIDGFTGGNMPPKASIREVRINSNPFSAEYDRPGFGRIEIFTKPGSDSFHGQAFAQYNNEDFNSRSPLLTSSQLPPYKQAFFGASLGGPLIKNQASFGLDFEHRTVDENAFILATTLDSNLNPQSVNQAVVTPQSRDTVSPRLDYKINANNTLVARYQFTRIGMDKEGVGNYNLPSTAYNETSTENTAQITETDILSPRAINETRFQYMRSMNANDGNNSVPTINVAGAFVSGGAQIGKSGSVVNNLELSNTTTFTYRTHTFKWGGRLRESFDKDTSVNNFGGSYTFFGGEGPELDANNQPIAGTEIQLTALDRYRRTLLFEGFGYSASEIQALGGGASQFSLTAGRPTTTVDQFDAGLFAGDDWRVRSNLTLSYGLRYEAQTNIHDLADWAPRFGLAWGIGGGAKNSAKTVLRAGLGMFYDRIASSQTLQAERYNGVTQQSYLILNPDFYPAIPSASELQTGLQPQQLQVLAKDLRAPQTLQASVGIERQVNSYFRISAQYIESRGIHLLRTRNINTPIDGVYPYGDADERILSETTGFSRSHQLFVAPNLRYKKMFLFGFYALSYGQDDNEGMPANPYNLRAEWGPSSFADVRHRAVIGTSLPVLWKFNVSPFLIASSGTPYNITTGQETLDTGSASVRPAFLSGVGQSQCQGGSFVYKADFGCFDLDPAPGMATIERNWARGPANVTLNLRLSRTWSFGNKGESGLENGGPPPGMGGARGGGPPPGGGGPGGGPPPGGGPGGGGPPPGMFGSTSGKKYNLTFSVSARNALNHPNYATPSGDLSSPYFGEYRSLAGLEPFGAATTYDRKIDLQLRFQF